MTARILPVDEWSRLVGTELESVWARFDPDRTRVLVVEQDGQIVGCWANVTVEHAEGVWIHPAHQGKTAVARKLWVEMQQLMRHQGASCFVASSHSKPMDRLLAKRGTALPAQEYVVWVPKS